MRTRWSEILHGVREDLNRLIGTLEDPTAPGARLDLAQLISEGNAGQSRIPGKHGGPPQAYSWLTVLVDDTPGQIAKLLTEIGEIGVNVEDLRLDHSSGQNVGMVEISVLPNKHDLLDRSPQRPRMAGTPVMTQELIETVDVLRPGKSLVVAIDGPSGSGKSSVSKEVARRLKLAYLDTGAMYRALTWFCLDERHRPERRRRRRGRGRGPPAGDQHESAGRVRPRRRARMSRWPSASPPFPRPSAPSPPPWARAPN